MNEKRPSRRFSNEAFNRDLLEEGLELEDAQPEKLPELSPEEKKATAARGQLKGKIEAALFMTGRALSLKEIADLVGSFIDEVEEALLSLINDYAFREESALEIDDSDGYILQIRDDYSDMVNIMMPVEITPAALRTLSAIAIKAPILQSDLIELRGSTAYDHIGELLARKLVSKRREGRSYVLNVTQHFHKYFKLLGEKRELEYLVRQSKPERTERLGGREELIIEDEPEAV